MDHFEFDFNIIPCIAQYYIWSIWIPCIIYSLCITAIYIKYKRQYNDLLEIAPAPMPAPEPAVKTVENKVKEPPLTPLVQVTAKDDMLKSFLNMTGDTIKVPEPKSPTQDKPSEFDQSYPAQKVPKDLIPAAITPPKPPMVTRSVTATASAIKAANDELKIPLKYKSLTILINEATLNTCYPANTYGTNIEVDKLTIKCHFVKKALYPSNKYINIFNNICSWLKEIEHVGTIELVIQKDSDIEWDQRAINAYNYIFDYHVKQLTQHYEFNQIYGIVTPKLNPAK